MAMTRAAAAARASRPLITLGSQRIRARSASFGIRVQTEVWAAGPRRWLYGPGHLAAEYWLSVLADQHSGEDGALWPEADLIPVARAAQGRHPFLSELKGLTVDDQGDWEAWYGNDAPPLENNRLTFGRWNPARRTIPVDWQATYSQQGRPFRFRGAVAFAGVSLKVKRAEDADAFVSQVLGGDYRARLRKRTGAWTDLGKGMPAGRRRWLEVRYLPR